MKIKFIKIDEREVEKNIANYKVFFGTPPKYIIMNENTSNIVKEITKTDLFYDNPKNDTFWGIPIAICSGNYLKDGEIELV